VSLEHRRSSPSRHPLRDAFYVLALAGFVAAGLHELGHLRRRIGPARPVAAGAKVVVAHTGREALSTWRAAEVRGRVLVHAGRFFHFVEDSAENGLASTPGAPGHPAEVDALLLRTAGPKDYLRAAASLGIARRIAYVSPPASLASRLANLGADRAQLPLPLPSEAFPRELLGQFPKTQEPVLLEIAASWFDDPEAPDPMDGLAASGLRADLVQVDLQEDADDVSDAARGRALAFARRLGALGTGG